MIKVNTDQLIQSCYHHGLVAHFDKLDYSAYFIQPRQIFSHKGPQPSKIQPSTVFIIIVHIPAVTNSTNANVNTELLTVIKIFIMKLVMSVSETGLDIQKCYMILHRGDSGQSKYQKASAMTDYAEYAFFVFSFISSHLYQSNNCQANSHQSETILHFTISSSIK